MLGLEHIAIAAKDSAELAERFETLLGISIEHSEEVPSQKVKTDFLRIGSSSVELLEATAEDSPISKFLQKRGNGVHHLAVRVDSIKKALAHFKARGCQLVDEEPRPGAGGCLTAFVHPKSFGGLLIELVEKPKD
ncbi:MAG: methylmalonyl-CoA epimerase [Bradymonadales bacterium]|nr:MAG: methylmalonyl-CoA epimerase [Bradymonadales bacterium]